MNQKSSFNHLVLIVNNWQHVMWRSENQMSPIANGQLWLLLCNTHLKLYYYFQLNQPTRCSNFSTAVAASGLPSDLGDSSVAVCGWPDHDQQHCYHQAPTVNQRLLLQLLWLLMMGMRKPKTCWAVSKRQVINLRRWGILLVDSVESMMTQGLANYYYSSLVLYQYL